ncbi:MAG: hypothetical protein WCK11_03750 [Candidatus Falkowbacteria bacterium]
MISKMSHLLGSRWGIAIKILPLVLVIVVLKIFAHLLGWEFLTLNSLFTALISANVFLIGFLISGVLVDYKESEKVPGDLAASLEALADEGKIILEAKQSPIAQEYLMHVVKLGRTLLGWFYKKVKTTELLDVIERLNYYFLAFEPLTQANFIVRLKQEQNLIRKTINRVHTIRETTFLGTGYAIVELITGILVFGFLFIRIEPFYESLFFIAFVSFMLIYMIFFIKDLDNPFGYAEQESLVEDVSLQPVSQGCERLERYLSTK